jgi:hypothetical protein
MAGEIYRHYSSLFPAPVEGSLKVWWIPQVPGKPFSWAVPNLETAVSLLNALAAYDDFQLAHNIKPDYANAGGLWVMEGGMWTEWYSKDGEDIDAYMRSKK